MWPWRRRETPGPAAEPARLPVSRGEWRGLPPIRRTVGEHPLINPVQRFAGSLSAWQNPSFLAPLGHQVGPAEPAGVIADLARPVGVPDLPVVTRSSTGGRRTRWPRFDAAVQRIAVPDTPPAVSIVDAKTPVQPDGSSDEPASGGGLARHGTPRQDRPDVRAVQRTAGVASPPAALPPPPLVRMAQAAGPREPSAVPSLAAEPPVPGEIAPTARDASPEATASAPSESSSRAPAFGVEAPASGQATASPEISAQPSSPLRPIQRNLDIEPAVTGPSTAPAPQPHDFALSAHRHRHANSANGHTTCEDDRCQPALKANESDAEQASPPPEPGLLQQVQEAWTTNAGPVAAGEEPTLAERPLVPGAHVVHAERPVDHGQVPPSRPSPPVAQRAGPSGSHAPRRLGLGAPIVPAVQRGPLVPAPASGPASVGPDRPVGDVQRAEAAAPATAITGEWREAASLEVPHVQESRAESPTVDEMPVVAAVGVAARQLRTSPAEPPIVARLIGDRHRPIVVPSPISAPPAVPSASQQPPTARAGHQPPSGRAGPVSERAGNQSPYRAAGLQRAAPPTNSWPPSQTLGRRAGEVAAVQRVTLDSLTVGHLPAGEPASPTPGPRMPGPLPVATVARATNETAVTSPSGWSVIQAASGSEPRSTPGGAASAEPPPPSTSDETTPAASAPATQGTAAAATTAAAQATAGGEPDELLKKLFDPLVQRLKAELWRDRERRGALTDLLH